MEAVEGMTRLAAGLSALLLASCAGPGATPGGPDPLAQLASFTLEDAANADAIYVAAGDMIGHACMPALAAFVHSISQTSTPPTVSGALSAFALARTSRLKAESGVANGLPVYLKLGCSALVMDEQTLLARLAGLGALVP